MLSNRFSTSSSCGLGLAIFESCFLKIERAKKHIADLEKVVECYIANDPYTMAINHDQQSGLSVAIKTTIPVPDEVPLLMGDAIHNLRTSLDHATWELIGIDNGTQDRWTKLPASATGAVDYNAACKGIKTPRSDTKQFFIDLAVHSDSGSALYAIHDLDNTDKHKILLPILAAAKIGFFRVLNPNGAPMMTMTDCTMSVGEDGVARIGMFGHGTTIETNNSSTITPAIFFGPNYPSAWEPVIPTLNALVEQASIAITAFRSFVENRDA